MGAAFNSFSGFHPKPDSSSFFLFQILLSIPSPDSTSGDSQSGQRAQHAFQFLLRIPPIMFARSILKYSVSLSIPSPDSTPPEEAREGAVRYVGFQFLLRIPLASDPTTSGKILCSFNSFSGFHKNGRVGGRRETGNPFNSFSGFHKLPANLADVAAIFQFLLRIPRATVVRLELRIGSFLSIPSPDSTCGSSGCGCPVMQWLPFQFLLRIPPRRQPRLWISSIGSFNSFSGFHSLVYRRRPRCRAPSLSIPSPDSTERFLNGTETSLQAFNSFSGFHDQGHKHSTLARAMTFNSFSGFHEVFDAREELRDAIGFQFLLRIPLYQTGTTAGDIIRFQFLLRIPHPPYTWHEKYVYVLAFQFLLRIPQPPGLISAIFRECLPFNSFSGFHRSLIPYNFGFI